MMTIVAQIICDVNITVIMLPKISIIVSENSNLLVNPIIKIKISNKSNKSIENLTFRCALSFSKNPILINVKPIITAKIIEVTIKNIFIN